jgi:hypothetical protein
MLIKEQVMRRHLLHISLALLTFTIGFLSSGSGEDVAAALFVALIVFVLLKKIASFNLTTHHLKVALLTLLIWTPFAALFLNTFLVLNTLPGAWRCELDLTQPEIRLDYGLPGTTFSYIGVMSVRTMDRGCIAMDEYESNDGVKVYTSTDEYEFSCLASKELQRRLRDEVKVIERSPVLDKYGRQIGERVVAISSYDGDGLIFRREGTKLQYIGSPLLSRALEFEKASQ